MTLPNIFATTPANSSRPGADLDTNFQIVGLLGIIPCSASGTNAITLTAAANMPTIGAYQNNLTLGFVAAGTSSGAVTLATLGLPQLPVYLQDGVTQAASGSLTNGTFYIVSYVSAYNGGGGGWSLTGNQPAASPDFSLLTVVENPPNGAVVAGSIGGGSSNNRAFEVGEIGGWSVLAEQIAASSANLSFDFSSFVADFEDFRFIGSYIANGTDATDLWLRTAPDGVTFDSGASNYSYISYGVNPAIAISGNSAGDTKIIINAQDTLGNSTQESISFDLTVFNAAQVSAFTMLNWTFGLQSSTPRLNVGIGTGRRLAAAAVKGVQFLPSAGVIATGKVSMLGRRKVT